MFPKVLALTIGLLVLASALLVLRHQRSQLTYEIVRLHRDHELAQRELWRAQTTAAQRMQPGALRERIQSVGLTLEPAVPANARPVQTQLVLDEWGSDTP